VLAVTGTFAGVLVAVLALLHVIAGDIEVYALGDWPAPFGIVLVLDRLSALMVLLTSIVGAMALLGALGGWDRRGRLFHPLFQLQLMGIQGAFLTGDIFNLFVFFEILLISSYGLLLHGGGAERSRAGIKYVVVNLTASALFLIGVGTLYGVTGTLNMADLAVKVPQVAADEMGLLRISALVLLVVFGVKAALIPLFFWLPDAYSRASAPVAALFAIMTKIGAYCILRVFTLAFDAPQAAVGASLAHWVLIAAVLTLLVGMIGAVATTELRRLIAYLSVASVGTMMIPLALFDVAGIAAALYYMIHSTLTGAAMFLLAEPIARQRGTLGDRLHNGPGLAGWAALGLTFMALSVAMAGVPPFSGFLGKTLILQALGPDSPLVWTVILGTSLLALIALSRAGSVLFWKSDGEPGTAAAPPPRGTEMTPVFMLLAMIVSLSVLADPVARYAALVATDLVEPASYLDAVLSTDDAVGEGA
jgi:multicomponent K+:H+ antiporter subunit D